MIRNSKLYKFQSNYTFALTWKWPLHTTLEGINNPLQSRLSFKLKDFEVYFIVKNCRKIGNII